MFLWAQETQGRVPCPSLQAAPPSIAAPWSSTTDAVPAPLPVQLHGRRAGASSTAPCPVGHHGLLSLSLAPTCLLPRVLAQNFSLLPAGSSDPGGLARKAPAASPPWASLLAGLVLAPSSTVPTRASAMVFPGCLLFVASLLRSQLQLPVLKAAAPHLPAQALTRRNIHGWT